MNLNHPVPHDVIARRAHQLWLQTGQQEGYATLQWLQAEAELLQENAQDHARESGSTSARQDAPLKTSAKTRDWLM